MQTIADRVGLSRPALYHHFDSKQEILSALVEEVTIRLANDAVAITISSADKDPLELFQDLVRAHATWILQHPQYFTVLQSEERNLPERLAQLQRNAKRELLEQLRVLLEKGVRMGRFRNVDPTVTALCVFGMCNWTAAWFRPGGRLSEAQVTEMIVDLAVGMVRRPADGRAGQSDDAMAWLSVLTDDVSHLRRVLSAKAEAAPRAPSSKKKAAKS
jgi:AcrR family transcriptional regulator